MYGFSNEGERGLNDMKTCFLISPIGKEGSEVRAFADKVRDFLRREVLVEDCLYDLTRADENITPSPLTDEMINHIIDDDLAIALLDYDNPNVYYEMGIRHAAGKVCLNIISDKRKQSEERIRPFDTKDILEITFPYSDMMEYTEGKRLPDELRNFEQKLRKAIKHHENGEQEVLTPVTRARRDFTLPPHITVSALIEEHNSRIASNIMELKSDIMELKSNVMKQLDHMVDTLAVDKFQSITHIEGEDKSFKALAEIVKSAKRKLKVSLFAPQKFHNTDNEPKRDFFNALCKFGGNPNRPDITCKCIMRMGQVDEGWELHDLMSRTCKGTMQLCVTGRNSNFELGVIDDSVAFLGFHDDKQQINSTFLITGKSAISVVEKTYDQIWDGLDYDSYVIRSADYPTPKDVTNQVEDIVKHLQLS